MAKPKRVVARSHMGSRYKRSSQGATVAALQDNFKASLAEILQGLTEFIDGVRGNAGEILVEALEPTFGKALEYCPVASGTLRDSGYLELEEGKKSSVVAIGFGRGGQPDYAIFVHEIPRAHEAPTRHKFLQDALDEDYWTILKTIPRLIKE